MKTAIVSSYCDWNSVGSVLQAQALQETLNTIGVKSAVLRKREVVDVRKIFLEAKTIKQAVATAIDWLDLANMGKRKRKNEEYIARKIRNYVFEKYEDVFVNIPQADVYIAGSDQIWNPRIDRPDFFLQYVEESSKCISYAASLGVSVLPKEQCEQFTEKFRKFSHISVRESDMVQTLEGLVPVKPVVHIDPTLLKTPEEWRKDSKEYKVRKPYILVYPIFWKREFNSELKELHKRTGCDIISIHYGVRNIYCTKQIQDVDPGEFIWLVDHAEGVVTSSFHGVAFSIIFNKKFSAVINPQSPSRIQSLLGLLGITTPEIAGCCSDFDVDYAAVNRKIKLEKERSLDYLRSAIFDDA